MRSILYNIKLIDYISDTDIRARFRDEALKILSNYGKHDCETFIYYNPENPLHLTLINDVCLLNQTYSRYGNEIVPIDFTYEETKANQRSIDHVVATIQLTINNLADDGSAAAAMSSMQPLFTLLHKAHTLLRHPPHNHSIYYSICNSAQMECAYMITQMPNHCLVVKQKSFAIDAYKVYGSLNDIPYYIWERKPDISNCLQELQQWLSVARYSDNFRVRKNIKIARKYIEDNS